MSDFTKYAGADWVQQNLHSILSFQESKKAKSKRVVVADNPQMSDFSREVADILGQAFRGIYHLQDSVYAANWTHPHWLVIPSVTSCLASWDSHDLMVLMVLCHDRCIRMEIRPHTFNSVKLIFNQRKQRDGGVWDIHPTVENHVELIRSRFGLGVIKITEPPITKVTEAAPSGANATQASNDGVERMARRVATHSHLDTQCFFAIRGSAN